MSGFEMYFILQFELNFNYLSIQSEIPKKYRIEFLNAKRLDLYMLSYEQSLKAQPYPKCLLRDVEVYYLLFHKPIS